MRTHSHTARLERVLRDVQRPSRLEVSIQKTAMNDQEVVLMSWRGALDLATVAQALESIEAASRLGTQIVIDLRGLDFLDSSGVEMLVEAVQDGHPLSVVVGSGRARRVADLSRLSDWLPVSVVSDIADVRSPHPIHDARPESLGGDYFG